MVTAKMVKTTPKKATSKKTAFTQKIHLVEGKFNPSEASDIMEALIRERINTHKIQELQSWIRNVNCKTDHLNQQICELLDEKKDAKDLIAEARKKGIPLSINATIEISIPE